jgi:hypothetical protein
MNTSYVHIAVIRNTSLQELKANWIVLAHNKAFIKFPSTI